MKPKEKAEELVLKYLKVDTNTKEWFNTHIAKQCALIAVDEIDLLLQNSTPKDEPYANLSSLEYWQEVKQEINNL
jgi:hypothetical protein